MHRLMKTFLLALVLCGNLISWNSAESSESRVKVSWHKTKPGSLHRTRLTGAHRRAPYTNEHVRNTRSRSDAGKYARSRNEDDDYAPSKNEDDDYAPSKNEDDDYAPSGNEDDDYAPSGNDDDNYAPSGNDDMHDDSYSPSPDDDDYSADNPDAENPVSDADDGYSHEDAVSGNQTSASDIQNGTYPDARNNSSPVNGSQLNGTISNSTGSFGNQTQTLTDPGSSNETQASTVDPTGLLSDLPQSALQKGNIFLGFLPDDGSSGGNRQTMAQLNSAIGKKAAVYGWYAQAHSGQRFDGSQLLAIIDDVKACKCVFQPAIMPVDGWKGLTSSDNSQAVAIAEVLKKFTDEGIPVWLRFAHEVNYYQTDGTYQGTAADFKAGWATVAAAIKQIAPSVKMWWTPNVSSEEDYEAYEPDDMNTVDLVGIDYYPKQLKGNDFLNAMKAFHDKYAVNGRKFAIGETGLGWSGSITDKTNWFNQICEAKSSLPEFISMAWFNFDKEYDYKIAGEPTLNQKFTALIAD